MAHVAKCIALGEIDLMKPTPPLPNEIPQASVSPPEKPFSWRMQQPESRKYQLFPKDRKLPVLNSSRTLQLGRSNTVSSNQVVDANEKALATLGLKKKSSQNNLGRRRKVSVPELGPMATVQEVCMDSPTIPGRPPFHERSSSAPGGPSEQHNLNHTVLYGSSEDDGPSDSNTIKARRRSRSKPELPLSPKKLPPLVIPNPQAAPYSLRHQQGPSHLLSRNESLRRERPEKAPWARPTITPNTSPPELGTPRSGSTNDTPTSVQTPVSAPPLGSRTESPKPWGGRTNTPDKDDSKTASLAHRRRMSESANIMDRGRPRKRSDPRCNSITATQKNETKQKRTSVIKEFAPLPKGYNLSQARERLQSDDITALQEQAFGEIGGFEILKASDVEALSKELHLLNERTEFLRRTYVQLRTSRRNLHARICQYLRSVRTTAISNETMLRQEEALADLDTSIDEWVKKMEYSGDRRASVRAKLLEHFAAVALLPKQASCAQSEPPVETVGDISTPPRSPSKQSAPMVPLPRSLSSSPSPTRVVAHVPSTILEHPLVEDAEAQASASIVNGPPPSPKRGEVESIRVYAGDDVYALLADVENEFTKIQETTKELNPVEEVPETQRIQLHRQNGHEMSQAALSGASITPTAESNPRSTPTPSLESPQVRSTNVSRQEQHTGNDLPTSSDILAP